MSKSGVLTVAFLAAAVLFAPGRSFSQISADPGSLGPVDYAFIGQTFLGNQYQIDSGSRVAGHSSNDKVKTYAALMTSSHTDVEKKLVGILRTLKVTQPPTSLLQGSYASMIATLRDDSGTALDHEYARQQLGYQNSNIELYVWEIANGQNAELKAFAQTVLPEIHNHLQLVTTLIGAGE